MLTWWFCKWIYELFNETTDPFSYNLNSEEGNYNSIFKQNTVLPKASTSRVFPPSHPGFNSWLTPSRPLITVLMKHIMSPNRNNTSLNSDYKWLKIYLTLERLKQKTISVCPCVASLVTSLTPRRRVFVVVVVNITYLYYYTITIYTTCFSTATFIQEYVHYLCRHVHYANHTWLRH